jgi:hypothetical protein
MDHIAHLHALIDEAGLGEWNDFLTSYTLHEYVDRAQDEINEKGT